jgi:hypothetical protein
MRIAISLVLLEQEIVVWISLDMNRFDTIIEQRLQLINIGFLPCRDKYTVVVQLCHPSLLEFL